MYVQQLFFGIQRCAPCIAIHKDAGVPNVSFVGTLLYKHVLQAIRAVEGQQNGYIFAVNFMSCTHCPCSGNIIVHPLFGCAWALLNSCWLLDQNNPYLKYSSVSI